MKHYTVYSTKTCKFCKEAVSLLTSEKLPFTVLYIEERPAVGEFLQSQGFTTVPQIYESDGYGGERKHIGGFYDLRTHLGT